MQQYSAIDIAKWFIVNNKFAAFPSRNGNLTVQKLCYYAQAMYMAVNDGNPLFEDTIEAWVNGPVVKTVYEEFRYRNLSEVVLMEQCENKFRKFPPDVEKVLRVTNSVYGALTAPALVDLTHSEDPWLELKDEAENRWNPEIKRQRIADYYKTLKDIYDSYDGYDFEHEKIEDINNNRFSYNTAETQLTEDDYELLWNYGDSVKGESFFVYKENDKLVVY